MSAHPEPVEGAHPEPVDSPLTLSPSKGERLAQDRPVEGFAFMFRRRAVEMRTILAVGILVLAHAPVAAQTPRLPRTLDGHPDLQGTYDIATMTPLERAPGTPLVMTKEEAAKIEQQRSDRVQRAALPSKGDRNAPPVGGDGSAGAAGNVGGYNNFWVDNGTEYYTIDGQKRMSVIIDPPDGRVPALTSQARQHAASRVARPTSD